MARKVIVALVLFTLLGLTLAMSPASAPATQEAAVTAEGPNGAIGNDEESKDDGLGFAEAAPVGGPVPAGTFSDAPGAAAAADTATTPPSKSGATILQVSTTVGATVAGFSLFYF
ncbi:hypothetical protein RND81_07G199700 [Saponaria officinalis]|uniref:Anther-specific protein BCP1 n=1 Tax=Saponaria officinalis TaxID=3572 RepID=A0AAW1JUZ8_SAPOF